MPYIDSKAKEELAGQRGPRTSGELNYIFTRAIVDYLWFMITNGANAGLRYQYLNDVNGALTGAQFEFNERVVKPYEKKKIVDNGDVYPLEWINE